MDPGGKRSDDAAGHSHATPRPEDLDSLDARGSSSEVPLASASKLFEPPHPMNGQGHRGTAPLRAMTVGAFYKRLYAYAAREFSSVASRLRHLLQKLQFVCHSAKLGQRPDIQLLHKITAMEVHRGF
jgi:hypothetical protein